jgi:hypothetical protein
MPAQRLIKGLVYQNGGRKPMYQGWCVCGTMIIALQDSTHSLSAVRQEVNLELVRINEASVLNYPLKLINHLLLVRSISFFSSWHRKLFL